MPPSEEHEQTESQEQGSDSPTAEDLAAAVGHREYPELVEVLAALVADPDPVLCNCGQTVATADSLILDNCRTWRNLAREVVENRVFNVFLVDFWG